MDMLVIVHCGLPLSLKPYFLLGHIGSFPTALQSDRVGLTAAHKILGIYSFKMMVNCSGTLMQLLFHRGCF